MIGSCPHAEAGRGLHPVSEGGLADPCAPFRELHTLHVYWKEDANPDAVDRPRGDRVAVHVDVAGQ